MSSFSSIFASLIDLSIFPIGFFSRSWRRQKDEGDDDKDDDNDGAKDVDNEDGEADKKKILGERVSFSLPSASSLRNSSINDSAPIAALACMENPYRTSIDATNDPRSKRHSPFRATVIVGVNIGAIVSSFNIVVIVAVGHEMSSSLIVALDARGSDGHDLKSLDIRVTDVGGEEIQRLIYGDGEGQRSDWHSANENEDDDDENNDEDNDNVDGGEVAEE